MPPDQMPIAEYTAEDETSSLEQETRCVADWESGSLPFLGALVRVRQIYHANPLIFDHGR